MSSKYLVELDTSAVHTRRGSGGVDIEDSSGFAYIRITRDGEAYMYVASDCVLHGLYRPEALISLAEILVVAAKHMNHEVSHD